MSRSAGCAATARHRFLWAFLWSGCTFATPLTVTPVDAPRGFRPERRTSFVFAVSLPQLIRIVPRAEAVQRPRGFFARRLVTCAKSRNSGCGLFGLPVNLGAVESLSDTAAVSRKRLPWWRPKGCQAPYSRIQGYWVFK